MLPHVRGAKMLHPHTVKPLRLHPRPPVRVALTCVRHYHCDRLGWDRGSRPASGMSVRRWAVRTVSDAAVLVQERLLPNGSCRPDRLWVHFRRRSLCQRTLGASPAGRCAHRRPRQPSGSARRSRPGPACESPGPKPRSRRGLCRRAADACAGGPGRPRRPGPPSAPEGRSADPGRPRLRPWMGRDRHAPLQQLRLAERGQIPA